MNQIVGIGIAKIAETAKDSKLKKSAYTERSIFGDLWQFWHFWRISPDAPSSIIRL
jgi:hypothetical protein